MVGPAPPIPSRFPCWVKAIYSWGGETKRDLGFIEGDLIECLNAGDGTWWTGRLRRDRRMVGLFPSNFVQVLDESFAPAPITRNSIPKSLGEKSSPSPQKQKSTFRKPFQAYEKLDHNGSVRSSTESTPEKADKPKSKWAPYSSMKSSSPSKATLDKKTSSSPLKEEAVFRVPSPPPRASQRSRASRDSRPQTMPANDTLEHTVDDEHEQSFNDMETNSIQEDYPQPQTYLDYRAASPYSSHDLHDSAVPTPHDPDKDFGQEYEYDDDEQDAAASSPPPAPPPHRVMHQTSQPSSHYDNTDFSVQQPMRLDTHTPLHSPGLTPSPLRDAMNDVISSLHDMSATGQTPPPQLPAANDDPWSPEAFEQLTTRSNPSPNRAKSQYGSARSHGPGNAGQHGDDLVSNPSTTASQMGPPQLSNYVQRMEHRLRHAKSAAADLSGRGDDSNDRLSVEVPRTDLGRSFSQRQRAMLHRKSAYELSTSQPSAISRSYTTKTSATASSSGWRSNATHSTNHTLSSVSSAGAVSATSAGSFARRKWGVGGSIHQRRPLSALSSRSEVEPVEQLRIQPRPSRPASPISGPSYHSSHASQPLQTPVADWTSNPLETGGILGGLTAPKARKSGFFKKMIATAKVTARTGAANARSTISSSASSRPSSHTTSPSKRSVLPDGITSISSAQTSMLTSSAHRDMGLGGGSEWMQVRRDVNRSNSLSHNEQNERAERCQMLDLPVLDPVEGLLDQAEGNESLDGLPITDPTDFNTTSLALVDKSTRFISSLPAALTPAMLAQSYLCRQYRSDVQRLRAIFIWVAERIAWEEDMEGQPDSRRVLQTKRGCTAEIASLVHDLCAGVGLHAEVVRGYLKEPGESIDLELQARPNHWWNAVIVDGEWRIMDCALASPTNAKQSAYSAANTNVADTWWFLARPMEVCYTHVPLSPAQQHICPPISQDILMALPVACPPYFKHRIELTGYNTSALYLDNLDMAQVKLAVPEDVECVARVEARGFATDLDGDVFESGDIVTKSALAQPQWFGGRKVITVKAVLPGDEGHGVLKIYAGKRGLMHSIKDNPHSLAVALPLTHTGQNPPFEFVIRHPTPHAQRHDLYVVQPQCHRLVIGNTFVFCIRQHPSSMSRFTPDTWGANGSTHNSHRDQRLNEGPRSNSALSRPVSPNPFHRPTSAMSMISASASVSQSGSNYSNESSSVGGIASSMTERQQKPAKLAMQSPGGKIMRLSRKQEYGTRSGGDEDANGLTTAWETVVKVAERGTWRGLVLADRSARWCVFAEWECI